MRSSRKRDGLVNALICSLGLLLSANMLFADTIPISLQNGASAIAVGTYIGAEDTYIRENYPFAAPGKYSTFDVGYDNMGASGRVRALIRFDLSGLKPLLIAGTTTVKSARLKLFLNVIAGTAPTGSKTVYLYRVATANKNWTAGTLTTRTDSAANTACWRYQLWNNNVIPPVTGVAQHQPWAGSVGASTSATDFFATPIASATITSASGNTTVVFEFTNTSFLTGWMNDATSNEGFLVKCPDLETGNTITYTALRFISSDNISAASRPIFEVTLENYDHAHLGAVSYTLQNAGKVSMTISDTSGYVVKQLLMGAQAGAGQSFQPWDCKRDPVHRSDTLNMVVPDGKYVVKMLQIPSEGLRAEYMLNLGFKDPSWKQWPGSHVTPNGIALDNNGIIIGSGGSESSPGMIKLANDGTFLWNTGNGSGWPNDYWGGCDALRARGDTLYAILINGQIERFKYSSSGITSNLGRWTTGYVNALGFGVFDLAIRKDKLITSGYSDNKIRWYTIPSGTADAAITVAGPKGVALDTAGVAYVTVGDSILKYTRGSATPTVFIGSGLKMPTKLDINTANGDVYVVEGDTGAITWTTDYRAPITNGARWQIKRFSSTGTLLGTFGALGGRNMTRGGLWSVQKHSFFWINNISVATDGSFYVSEAWPPRRVAHFSNTGVFIEEWLAPPQCDVHASSNPADPTDVWYDSYGGYMLRAKVDYVNKNYTLVGYYNTGTHPLTKMGWGCDGPVWNVQSRGGKTYLYWTGYPVLVVYDSLGDSLRAVARAFTNSASSDPAYPDGSITWNDLNGDGREQSNEMITYAPGSRVASGNPSMFRQATYNMHMDSNFVYQGMFHFENMRNVTDSISFLVRQPAGKYPMGWGPSLLTPTQITTVGTTAVPTWDWQNVTWPTQGFPAGTTNYDSLGLWGPGPAYAQYATGIWPYVMRDVQQQSVITDDEGNLFEALNYEKTASWQRRPPEFYGATGDVSNGGNAIVKYDRTTGKNLWMAGRHATGYVPNPGEVVYVNGILGTAHGCVIVRDYYRYQYVWNTDGLWVGRLLENIVDAQKNNAQIVSALGEASSQWGEQFAGSAREIKDNNTPGLSKGDVLFFGFGTNDARIVRVSGWTNWISSRCTVTVANGQITGQSAQQVVGVRPNVAPVKSSACALSISEAGLAPRITYSIASRMPVSLEIYTVLGQKVATLIDQTLDAGVYSVNISGTNVGGQLLRSGFYVVRLNAGSTQLAKSFVKMR